MRADQDERYGAHAPKGGAEGIRRRMCMTLPATSHSVRLARHATRVGLAAWRLGRVEENAVLIVSELVTNAIRHAEDTDVIGLDLQAGRTWLRIEVQDTDQRWPQPRIPACSDESGFGFVLVEALAGQWGVRETETGKAVWAQLDTGQGLGRKPGTVT